MLPPLLSIFAASFSASAVLAASAAASASIFCCAALNASPRWSNPALSVSPGLATFGIFSRSLQLHALCFHFGASLLERLLGAAVSPSYCSKPLQQADTLFYGERRLPFSFGRLPLPRIA